MSPCSGHFDQMPTGESLKSVNKTFQLYQQFLIVWPLKALSGEHMSENTFCVAQAQKFVALILLHTPTSEQQIVPIVFSAFAVMNYFAPSFIVYYNIQLILYASITNMIWHEICHKVKRFPQFWTCDSSWQIPALVSVVAVTRISCDFPLEHSTPTFISTLFSLHPNL